MLDKLWISTRDLHARFGSRQTVEQALACFREEVEEVEAATTPAEITEECVDVIVTLMGVMMARGENMNLNMLASGDWWLAAQVMLQNETKAHWTGYIRRREEWLANTNLSAALDFMNILFVVCRIVQDAGTEWHHFNAAVAKVIAKNDGKDSSTHRLNEAGKIQRIGRV